MTAALALHGFAGWRMKPARRGDVRPVGAGAEARGQLPKASVVTDRLRAVMIEPSSWDLNEVKVPCFPRLIPRLDWILLLRT